MQRNWNNETSIRDEHDGWVKFFVGIQINQRSQGKRLGHENTKSYPMPMSIIKLDKDECKEKVDKKKYRYNWLFTLLIASRPDIFIECWELCPYSIMSSAHLNAMKKNLNI